jgi:hypothetical protein
MSAIYFAKVGDYVKIGFASNPRARMRTLLKTSRLIVPDDLDRSQPVELILVIPFCRMRDERNMQMLFTSHWVVGEWFRWSPAFAYQMRTMRFVTEDVRRKDLRRARRELGILQGAHVKEERWGKQTSELLAEARERLDVSA